MSKLLLPLLLIIEPFLGIIHVSIMANEALTSIHSKNRSDYDARFLGIVAAAKFFKAQDVKEKLDNSYLNLNLVDALALCEIAIAKNVEQSDSLKESAIQAKLLLNYIYSSANVQKVLPQNLYENISNRFDLLSSISNDQINPINNVNEQTIKKEVDYLTTLAEKLRKPNAAERLLLAEKMLKGSDGYAKNLLGGLALLASSQHDDPGFPNSYYMLGELFVGKSIAPEYNGLFNQDTERAYSYYQEALNRNPKDIDSLYRLGQANVMGWAPNGVNTIKAEKIFAYALSIISNKENHYLYTRINILSELENLKMKKKSS